LRQRRPINLTPNERKISHPITAFTVPKARFYGVLQRPVLARTFGVQARNVTENHQKNNLQFVGDGRKLKEAAGVLTGHEEGGGEG
jgi:hypothetical protein